MDHEEPRSHAWYHGAIPRQVTHTHVPTHTNLSHESLPLKPGLKLVEPDHLLLEHHNLHIELTER